ncbi:hypothetical protein Poli38472_009111 [Pythium oligandrum]|uniref:Uncharacterized protein n=1 Tax=Pythium oligandrum TaxID=41045 RepID=A0A8K1CJZ1_PYTOL|nr:hypothetical protein Poli38472_009111 [Pythium oligandrum]|eukprot:TMW64944.1 hypothetical protein Poli38472_009111 [Pythium oligandrum]
MVLFHWHPQATRQSRIRSAGNMASLGDEERELIQKDREENPGCFYSTALSQSCRSVNGDSKCEIVKKIFRQCPGKNRELISNRKEVTEDEHAGEDMTKDDFFNHERMDSRKGDLGSFFDPFRQREDDFEAQLSPFDFFRQEMLRPFESFFGGGLFGGGNGSLFGEDFEREFERMPVHPPSRRPSNQPPPPSNPPHYSYHPSEDARRGRRSARSDDKKDMFAGYKGPVEEI